jgi:glycosyltransferase involved in cell wall biosynthesis
MDAPTRWRDPGPPPHLSLLVCTIDREAELERLLLSLCKQRYRNFEVILVDQNPDERLSPLISRFAGALNIQRVRSERGLSRSRNVGLGLCRGDIVALPDDDCWYPASLLDRIVRVFQEHPEAGFLVGRWQDPAGNDMFGRWPDTARPVLEQHVWTRAISFTTFLRRPTICRVGPFDERLGVGAGTPWGAGEETDYLLRAMECGIGGWFDPACVVHHPPPERFSSRAASRAFSYGRGIGFVLRKHCAGSLRVLRFLGRPLMGAVLFFFTFRWRHARFHLLVFTGRCIGFLGV